MSYSVIEVYIYIYIYIYIYSYIGPNPSFFVFLDSFIKHVVHCLKMGSPVFLLGPGLGPAWPGPGPEQKQKQLIIIKCVGSRGRNKCVRSL